MRPFLRILLGLLLLPALGAVAGCTEEPPADPKALLATAKRRLDAASTVRFELTGTRLPDTGGYLVSGSGTAKRPASFEGRFRIAVGGVAATVEVVSVNGTLYAQLPFQDDFVRTDPDTLGIRDPAELLSPKGGLSSLLSEARGLKSHGRSRKGQEVLEEVTARIPGRVVGRFLFVADESAPIHTTFRVDVETGELREATFRGPFYDRSLKTTYALTLDRYGEAVDIEEPVP